MSAWLILLPNRMPWIQEILHSAWRRHGTWGEVAVLLMMLAAGGVLLFLVWDSIDGAPAGSGRDPDQVEFK